MRKFSAGLYKIKVQDNPDGMPVYGHMHSGGFLATHKGATMRSSPCGTWTTCQPGVRSPTLGATARRNNSLSASPISTETLIRSRARRSLGLRLRQRSY